MHGVFISNRVVIDPTVEPHRRVIPANGRAVIIENLTEDVIAVQLWVDYRPCRD
jgi:hypothetical protein